jgi:hypothetical protein
MGPGTGEIRKHLHQPLLAAAISSSEASSISLRFAPRSSCSECGGKTLGTLPLAALQGSSTDSTVPAAVLRALLVFEACGLWFVGRPGPGFRGLCHHARATLVGSTFFTMAEPSELRYGGYSRFELELEVGHHLEVDMSHLVNSIIVCAVSGKPTVPELPGQPEGV